MDKEYERNLVKQIARNPDLKVLEKELRKVKDLESKYNNLSYPQILRAINLCKERVSAAIYDNSDLDQEEQYKRNNSVLNRLLPEVYALVSIAFKKSKNVTITDTQIMTGIALHYGSMVELGTGEGKTYSGAFPAVLNALTGKGVHVVTSNDYLAKRDFEDLKPIFDVLGITSSYIPAKTHDSTSNEENTKEKREGYRADICFGSNSTFAFDYLFDSISKNSSDIVQRPQAPFFALIDEVDDTLFDSAQIPYIISTPAKIYRKVKRYDNRNILHERNMNAEELAKLLDVDLEDMLKRSNLFGDFDIKIGRETLIPYKVARTISERLYNEELLPDDIPIQQKVENFISNNLDPYAYRCNVENKFGWSIAKLFNHLADNPYNERGINSWEESELVGIRDKYPLVLGFDTENNPRYALTSSGEISKQNYFFYDYLLDNPSLIHELAYNIIFNSLLKNGRDFTENKDGTVDINFERIGFVSDVVPELKKIRNQYLVSDEYSYVSSLLEIGLRAHYELERDKDYVVDDPMPGKKTPEIKLIINGRAEEGRTFSDGLHEAIGLKEKKKMKTNFFKIGGQNKTNASISQKAYYARYSKKAGMTGTTPYEGYVAKLYDGMYVVKMPRTAVYDYVKSRFTSEDKPIPTKKANEQFTDTDIKKYELILKSIVKSRESNPKQPVLITTTSLADSEALAGYIKMHGKKYGIDSFSLLNAKTDPKIEAVIIAQAGRPGAITISTEMAGRGTDIKLGGDRDKLIDFYLDRFYEERKIDGIYNNQRLDDLSLLRRGIELNRQITSSINPKELDELVTSEAIKHYRDTGRKFSSYKEIEFCKAILSLPFNKNLRIDSAEVQSKNRELLRGVGLKVILSGHFANKRIDEQAEGRQNRRGYDGGVIEYYSSKKDLLNIGIDSRIIDPLIALYSIGTKNVHSDRLKKDAYKRIMKQIARAQKRNDESLFEQIKQVQDLNLLSSAYRSKIRSDRMAIITGEEVVDKKEGSPRVKIDYKEKMDYLIDETIRFILVSNIRGELGKHELKMKPEQIGLSPPTGNLTLDRWTDLTDSSMDGARFALEIEGALGGLFQEVGVTFNSAVISKFSTVEKMMKAISTSAKNGLNARLNASGEDLTEVCRSLYTSIYDKSSVASLEVAKDVELQDRIYKSMQNQHYNPIIAFVNSMNGVMRGMQQDIVGLAFGRRFSNANSELIDAVRDAKIERSHNDAYLSDENRRVTQSSPKSIEINKHNTTSVLSTGAFVVNRDGVLTSNGAKVSDISNDFAFADAGGNRK